MSGGEGRARRAARSRFVSGLCWAGLSLDREAVAGGGGGGFVACDWGGAGVVCFSCKEISGRSRSRFIIKRLR